jgi:hypothetical protein
MTISQAAPSSDDFNFNLVTGGPSSRLAELLGLEPGSPARRLLKVAVLLCVTWLPLLILTLLSGHAIGDLVKIPFLHDPEVHARLLFVLPLLELARVVVAVSLRVQARHLREMGVVPKKEWPRFDAARARALALRESAWAEAAILAVAYLLALVLRLVVGISEGDSSWERTESAITPAGWWFMLISLPILYFFILRWFWIFVVWAQFLFRVSRLDLELTPTHPDRAGGLGFLGWGLVSFAAVLMAVSAVVSAAFADQILHRGESLDSLKYHVVAFIAGALIIVHAPLLAFSGRLSRCRFTGLLEFGALVWRHDTAFDEKWIKHSPDPNKETILGSSDVQSMADIATCYDHVDRMWLAPFDTKAFAVLVLAALLPMIPLLGTEIPLQEIFSKLAELLI